MYIFLYSCTASIPVRSRYPVLKKTHSYSFRLKKPYQMTTKMYKNIGLTVHTSFNFHNIFLRKYQTPASRCDVRSEGGKRKGPRGR